MLQAVLLFTGSWNWNPLLTTLRHRQIWMLLPQSEMCLVFRHIAFQYWRQESKTMPHAQSCSYVTAVCETVQNTCIWLLALQDSYLCGLSSQNNPQVYLDLSASAVFCNLKKWSEESINHFAWQLFQLFRSIKAIGSLDCWLQGIEESLLQIYLF